MRRGSLRALRQHRAQTILEAEQRARGKNHERHDLAEHSLAGDHEQNRSAQTAKRSGDQLRA